MSRRNDVPLVDAAFWQGVLAGLAFEAAVVVVALIVFRWW